MFYWTSSIVVSGLHLALVLIVAPYNIFALAAPKTPYILWVDMLHVTKTCIYLLI